MLCTVVLVLIDCSFFLSSPWFSEYNWRGDLNQKCLTQTLLVPKTGQFLFFVKKKKRHGDDEQYALNQIGIGLQ